MTHRERATFSRALFLLGLALLTAVLAACQEGSIEPAETDTLADQSSSDPTVGDDDEDLLAVWTCPPEGPFGGAVGETPENLQFSDCDGSVVGLHDLCGANAGLIFNFYGW